MKAERLVRNFAQRLEREAAGVSQSILKDLDEILTVNRLGLPPDLRRSLACTNIIESMNSISPRRDCWFPAHFPPPINHYRICTRSPRGAFFFCFHRGLAG